MKTFLDLQDTELCLELTLRVRPIGNPQLKISINDDVAYQWNSEHSFSIQRQLPLLDPFLIKIELLEKDYMAPVETAAVIEQLKIDSFELVPAWTQLAQYKNDHNHHEPTNYLGFVGTWQLAVNRPFYQWWHSSTGQGLLLTLGQ
jgi:hypothetical protein